MNRARAITAYIFAWGRRGPVSLWVECPGLGWMEARGFVLTAGMPAGAAQNPTIEDAGCAEMSDGLHASALRRELMARSRQHARGRLHAESYGNPAVIVFAPEEERHGNFFDAAYAAIEARPEWARRLKKIHAQSRALPRVERKWRELDSSMSSDALLMNVFCTPGAAESAAVRSMLGIDAEGDPAFGWRARVPLRSGRVDRTEVDMRWGDLLVEAKLTEADFQSCRCAVVEGYRDVDVVFDRALLPRVEIATERRKEAAEFPEEYSQEEEYVPAEEWQPVLYEPRRASVEGYASYQLIRNVLAAHAQGGRFCVIHDARRPDLREAWFEVMAAVRSAEMRTRLMVLTWQEVAAELPRELQEFLDRKYGIVAPGAVASQVEGTWL